MKYVIIHLKILLSNLNKIFFIYIKNQLLRVLIKFILNQFQYFLENNQIEIFFLKERKKEGKYIYIIYRKFVYFKEI